MHTCRSLLPDLELRMRKNLVFSELVSIFVCLELRDVWDFVSSLFSFFAKPKKYRISVLW